MYQVMIVDDEEPVLDSFSFILEKNITDFTLCGKARSGTEAVSLIKEQIPDLVFMDIQMPGIDGIETIRQVRHQFPNTVFILATAYERFDIAQKAIPLGVFSYMVKPISRKALLDELMKAKAHLDRLRDRDRRRLEEARLLQKTKEEEKNRFLCNLIWKNPDAEEWAEFARLFSINSDRGTLYLIEASGDVSESLKKNLYDSITEKIQFKYHCLGTMVAGRMMLFFPEEQSLNKLNSHLQNILRELSPYSFVLGHGKVSHCSNLKNAFFEAFQPFAKATEEEKSYSAEKTRQQNLFHSILGGDKLITGSLYEEYWLEKFNSYSFQVAKAKMVAFFTLLLYKLDDDVLSAANFRMDPAEEIMALETVEQWKYWSSRTLERLQALIQLNLKQSYPRPLTAALAYIRQNYQKPLQLSLVAQECRITGSYLSRLFREHLDTNFIDYINRYRLNKAIILLEEKKYSIKEISYIVGYQDPNYFSRVFRRVMGVSPSDLEKEGVKNDD